MANSLSKRQLYLLERANYYFKECKKREVRFGKKELYRLDHAIPWDGKNLNDLFKEVYGFQLLLSDEGVSWCDPMAELILMPNPLMSLIPKSNPTLYSEPVVLAGNQFTFKQKK